MLTASSSPPWTGNHTSRTPAIRRSFTAPPSSSTSSATDSQHTNPNQTCEVLFGHQSCKIVRFTTRATRSASASETELEEPAGKLPWATATERTVASGHCQIYRMQSEIVFLKCSTTVHPIFPRTQCWCVDGETKFVLRIRESFYYRVEFPNTSDDDRKSIEKLKEVLGTVLQYEQTECPFERGFYVEIPAPPQTPTRRRPWTPKHRSTSAMDSPTGTLSQGPAATSSRAALSTDTNGAAEDRLGEISEGSTVTPSHQSSDGFLESDDLDTPRAFSTFEDLRVTEDSTNLDTQRASMESAEPSSEPSMVDAHIASFEEIHSNMRDVVDNTHRSVTAPARAMTTVAETASSEIDSKVAKQETDNASIFSADSFHSFPPSSTSPPSPPYSRTPSPLHKPLGIDVKKTRRAKGAVSLISVTDGEVERTKDMKTPEWLDIDDSPTPAAKSSLSPDSASSSDDVWLDLDLPSPQSTLRHRLHQRRPRSPLPSPTVLYSPRNGMSGHDLTTAILQKTCSLLLGPPVQLIALMLNIAAKIASGAFRRAPASFTDAGHPIPGTWSYSDSEDDGLEDDYGHPIANIPATTWRSAQRSSGAWEID